MKPRKTSNILGLYIIQFLFKSGMSIQSMRSFIHIFKQQIRDFPGGAVVKNPPAGGFPGGAVVENLPANAGDTGSSPGLGGSHVPWSNWAREPQLLSLHVWSLCSATREAAIVRGPCTAMKSGPHLPQLEKTLAQKRRPNIAINQSINQSLKKKKL